MSRREYINSRIMKLRSEKRATQRFRLSTLQWALLVSIGIHVLLLTVRFVDPERFNRMFQDTPLEVILVNARTDERVREAQAIAQAALAGGGEAQAGSRLGKERRREHRRKPGLDEKEPVGVENQQVRKQGERHGDNDQYENEPVFKHAVPL